jgi:flagellar basal body-associated protein FliL
MEEMAQTTPQPKSSRKWLIIVIVVVVLCCLCAVLFGVGWWLWKNGDQLLKDWGLTLWAIGPLLG